MPPRLQPRLGSSCSILPIIRPTAPVRSIRQYAMEATITQGTTLDLHLSPAPVLTQRHPKTQPPSYKPAEFRKTQLLRSYASLLRSTPLMVLFQHNNLKSSEWVPIRRELTKALQKVDAELGHPVGTSEGVKLQIIQTGIFAAALRVVEYFQPEQAALGGSDYLTHALSKAAHDAVAGKKRQHALTPLLAGPLVVLTFPTVSPQHLKAALSVLAPSAPKFPAPTRKANPGWHEPAVQSGLQKLLLLGARVEGRVFDVEGARLVGGIEGGLDGLRAQLVYLLQSMGAGVTNTLESAAKNLYFTMESRRTMLEEEGKPAVEEAPKE